jgi:hypothetical protein
MVQNKPSPPAPMQSPEKVPSEPGRPHTNKMRASEVVIIIAVIFAVIICVLLVLGAIALVRNLPVWWKQIFGLQIHTWFVG